MLFLYIKYKMLGMKIIYHTLSISLLEYSRTKY